MHTSITNEQLVKFVLNDVNEEEHIKIIEAISSNPATKQEYLFVKRKHDVERFIYDEIDIGEYCEIEELIKTDPRLYDHFELNTDANDEEEQGVSINVMHISITKEQLVNFVLNDVNEEEHKKISKAIHINSLTKERYLFEKRKYDVERYFNDEMNFGECCEIEELLKTDTRLQKHFELIKGVNEEEQNVPENFKHIAITKEQLVNFVLNKVNEEERKKISEAINTKSLTRERYLFEKRKYDIERYIADKMDIGERCEIEELIKTDENLLDHFELNNGVIEEEQDESISIKQINITNEQLIDFVLNDVNEKERNKISEAINTNPLTKERFLFEKRKYDIERYLNDKMDFGERCEIEELIKINSRLHAHFELNKDVNEFMETALKEQLENIQAELYGTDNAKESGNAAPVIKMKNNILRMSKWAAAASVILFISTFGLIYITSNQNTIEEKMYNKYYEPFQTNANNFFNSSTLLKAKNKYINREYDIAWLLIEKLPDSMTIEAEKTLYAGLTLMELERYNNAIDKFELLQANEEKTVIHSISQWYLALCYLNTEKRADAIVILENIITNKTYNYSKAKKILQKIN